MKNIHWTCKMHLENLVRHKNANAWVSAPFLHDYVKPSGSQQHYLYFLKDLVGLRAELRAWDDVSAVNSVKKTQRGHWGLWHASQLFIIYSIIYLYKYKIINIYFILWVISQNYFIAQTVPTLVPVGVFSVGYGAPLKHSHQDIFFQYFLTLWH